MKLWVETVTRAFWCIIIIINMCYSHESSLNTNSSAYRKKYYTFHRVEHSCVYSSQCIPLSLTHSCLPLIFKIYIGWCCCCCCCCSLSSLALPSAVCYSTRTNNKIHDFICLFFVLTWFSWILSAGSNGRKITTQISIYSLHIYFFR